MLILLIPILAIFFVWKLIKNPTQVKTFFGRIPPIKSLIGELLFMIAFSLFGLSLFMVICWGLSYIAPELVTELMTSLDEWASGFPTDGMSVPVELFFTLLLGLAIPFFEEALFRGVILRFLARKGGAITGLILSSIIFGVMHGLGHGLTAAISGVFLGIVFLKYRSVLASYFCHAFNNTVAIIAVFAGAGGYESSASHVYSHFSSEIYFYLILLAITLPPVIYYLRKNWKYVVENDLELAAA